MENLKKRRSQPIQGMFPVIRGPVTVKYPMPGELYDSLIYPGQRCRVVSVLDAKVTLQWLGQFAHISQQTVMVNQFVQDFSPSLERRTS